MRLFWVCSGAGSSRMSSLQPERVAAAARCCPAGGMSTLQAPCSSTSRYVWQWLCQRVRGRHATCHPQCRQPRPPTSSVGIVRLVCLAWSCVQNRCSLALRRSSPWLQPTMAGALQVCGGAGSWLITERGCEGGPVRPSVNSVMHSRPQLAAPPLGTRPQLAAPSLGTICPAPTYS